MVSPLLTEERRVALFASLDALKAYDLVAVEDHEVYQAISACMRSLSSGIGVDASLHDAHLLFGVRMESLGQLVSIIDNGKPNRRFRSPIKRALMACVVATLATADDTEFELWPVLTAHNQLKGQSPV